MGGFPAGRFGFHREMSGEPSALLTHETLGLGTLP